MIFFANAEGTITQSINTPINQGSNGANEGVLICPFSATAITARYILPNGEITRPYLMDKCSPDGNCLYAYRALLDGAVTRKSGTVTAQFTLWNGNTQLPTVSTSFFVNKGVPNIPEYKGEDAFIKEEILPYLTSLGQEIADNVIKEYNLGDNNGIGNYQIVFEELGYKDAPAVYNNFVINYGEYAGKIGTLFVVAKDVDNERHQNEILYVGDEVYTRLITIGEEAEDGAWVCSVDKELSKTSTRAISNKAVFEEFERVQNEIPIVVDEVLNLTGVSLETFESNYANSIDAESLNRIPKKGEKMIALAKLKGDAIYSFLAEFTHKDGVNDKGFCEFRVIEKWLIHQPLDSELSSTSTNPVENKVITKELETVRKIAQGKQTGYVFDTKADLDYALANDKEFVENLNAGDDLFIKEKNQPDYWWTGTEALESEGKTDLDNYYNKEEIDASLETLASKHLQAVTDISVIYESVEDLPETASNGTTVVVKTNGGLPLMLYAFNDNQWAYKYNVRSQTLYLDLKTNTLYRYTMSEPFLVPLNYLQKKCDITDKIQINTSNEAHLNSSKSLYLGSSTTGNLKDETAFVQTDDTDGSTPALQKISVQMKDGNFYVRNRTNQAIVEIRNKATKSTTGNTTTTNVWDNDIRLQNVEKIKLAAEDQIDISSSRLLKLSGSEKVELYSSTEVKLQAPEVYALADDKVELCYNKKGINTETKLKLNSEGANLESDNKVGLRYESDNYGEGRVVLLPDTIHGDCSELEIEVGFIEAIAPYGMTLNGKQVATVDDIQEAIIKVLNTEV